MSDAGGDIPGRDADGPRVGDELDDFLLVDDLGEGAFARVFLAHQKSMHRTVALKVHVDRSIEAQTLAQLDHPNIVRVHDQRTTADGELHLLYMEYVPAGTLEAVVDQMKAVPASERSGRLVLEVVDAALAGRGATPPLDSLLRAQLEQATWPEAVCLLGAQLARALDYAHAHDVLHRDVKPANVLLAATGRPKLADFNISYSAALEVASAEEYMGGSLPFMSPEQLETLSPFHDREADTLDARSDVFGLGVVLWELLSGTLPFPEPPEGISYAALFQQVVSDRRAGVQQAAIDALPPDVPAMVVEALTAALAPQPADRPAAAVLARRLELCLDGRLRRLLTGADAGWERVARARPLTALVTAVLVPNVVLSVLNILYNVRLVVDPGQRAGFFRQVQIVNAVAFPLGIAVGLALAAPVVRALRARRRGDLSDPAARAAARLRTLRLGGALAAVLLPIWVAVGFAFPLWRAVEHGEAGEGAVFHFMLSHLMFGLLSATLCYFLVNALAARVALPSLIVPGDEDAPAVRAMQGLRRRLVFWFAGCVIVPFVSIVLLATRPEALAAAMQATWTVLGLLGAGAFGLALVLSRAIQRDLETLEGALQRGGSTS